MKVNCPMCLKFKKLHALGLCVSCYQKEHYTLNQKSKIVYYIKNKKRIAIRIHNKYLSNKLVMHDLKINGCAMCGYNKCDSALEFHHVNSNKKIFCIDTSKIGDVRLVKEINKCILLCANCHMVIHTMERAYEGE